MSGGLDGLALSACTTGSVATGVMGGTTPVAAFTAACWTAPEECAAPPSAAIGSGDSDDVSNTRR